MTICQKCGDKGDQKRIVHCMKCQISAEHRYCLDKLPKDDRENFIWTCHECAPKEIKLDPISFRKSERISLREVLAAEVRMDLRKRWRQDPIKSTVVHTVRSAAVKPLTCELNPDEKKKKLPSCGENYGNQVSKPKRKVILEYGSCSDDESELAKVNASQSAHDSCDGALDKICSEPCLESNDYVPAQPVIDPIWRGCFIFGVEKKRTTIELASHLSSKACPRVGDVARVLPPLLIVEILPRTDAWPEAFKRSPPTDNDIALYFLPQYEKDETVFDTMLENMIRYDRAFKAVVHNVELLIFSSRELPTQHWRYQRKYYMWAVCLQRQDFLPLKPTYCAPVKNRTAECVSPSKLKNDGRSQEERDPKAGNHHRV